MAYVIGIDTGGTYIDSVLLYTDNGTNCVKRKAKSFTFHNELELGIKSSIEKLEMTPYEIVQIEKVVLSTTLATNAIVEGNFHKVGLIIIGDKPKGNIATEYIKTIDGAINIKGRILANIDKEKTKNAIEALIPKVESIAVSGAASVRNPVLEQEVKNIINSVCDLPVMCGHELASDLGFLERTNTVVINAGLLPIINQFINAIKTVLAELNIKAPVFVVKGDGSISKLDAIKDKPIDTVLSGPAASMIGAINLTQLNNAVVSDMGGTTTDTGVVRDKRVELSSDGAVIGNWKIRIKSAKLYTSGLGGDSQISIDKGNMKIGPKRVLPACRDGGNVVTPTDILHYIGEFENWSKEKAVSSIENHAHSAGITPDEYVKNAIEVISRKIIDENISLYKYLDFPICAIGAPAKSWYHKAKEKYDFDVVIPENYEVANAVGAATAGIQEVVESVVRPGEEGHGYLVHTKISRFTLMKKEEAVNKAVDVSKEYAMKMILDQGLELAHISVSCEDIYNNNDQLIYEQIYIENDENLNYENKGTAGLYLGTNIKVTVSGKIFVDGIPSRDRIEN